MSVIVVLKEEDKLWVAADSQSTWGTRPILLTEQTSKVWQHPRYPNVIFGSTGEHGNGQVIRYSDSFLTDEEIVMNKIDTAYVFNVLYKRWMNALLSHNFLEIPSGHKIDEYFSDSLLLVVNGNGWILHSGGWIDVVETVEACGCGRDAALLYLKCSTEPDPKKKLIAAVKTVAEDNIYVDDNVVIYCSEAPKAEARKTKR